MHFHPTILNQNDRPESRLQTFYISKKFLRFRPLAKLKMLEDRRRKVFKNLDPAFEMNISVYTLRHTSEESKPKSTSEKIGSFFSRKSSSRSSRKSINPLNLQSTSQASAISTVSRVGTMTRAVLGPV